MATTSKVKSDTKAEPRPERANNFRRGEAPKYTPEMRAEIQKLVTEAEESGNPSSAVYERLAAKWSKKTKQEYTGNQVSSQFYFTKSKLKKQAKRRAAAKAAETRAANKAAAVANTATAPAPKAKAKTAPRAKAPKMALPTPLVELNKMLQDMQQQIAAAQTDAKAQARRADAAERALARARKALQ